MLPYHLRIPNRILYPIIATIPHSGLCIPDEVAQRFKQPRPIFANADWFLDQLYDFLPDIGITVLQATYSRYVVDVNRPLKAPLYGPYKTSAIYAESTFGRPLYDVPPTLPEINERINQCYHPFHDQLTRLLEETIQRSGKAYLLDLHSFFVQSGSDVCLSNQRNHTSTRAFLHAITTAFRREGFSVANNEVLFGGYITQHYGNKQDVESVQIELRYPAYLDQTEWGEEEATQWDSPHFRETQARLKSVFANVITYVESNH